MKHITLLLLIFLAYLGNSQEYHLDPSAKISILTMGPGDQLYDAFGHSAFRVKDSVKGLDIVYNYGVYDFNTPNFYTKFARGKLLYLLAVTRYQPFFEYYKRQNRCIEEQILNLNAKETQKVFNFLANNAKPENRAYKYDFLYDNCATKIRDVLAINLGDTLQFPTDYLDKPATFRQLIQKNVHWNSWGSVGMDIAIGAVVDKKASPWEFQFLPEYVKKSADKATLNRQNIKTDLVASKKTLFKGNIDRKNPTTFLLSPLFIFLLIAIIIIFITYKDAKQDTRNRFLDGSIFFITGSIGIFLFLLWVATDHSTTANNYNLLWAFPLNLLFFITIIKKQPPKWLKKYVTFLIIMLFLLFVHWITGIQEFAITLLPLFLALLYRYLFLIKVFSGWKQHTE